MAEQYQSWVNRAREQLAVARYLFDGGFYFDVFFHCQQAIELMLKALYMSKHRQLAPRIHNLAKIAQAIPIDVPEKFRLLFTELSVLYARSRYEAHAAPDLARADRARSALEASEEVLRWLEGLLP